MNYLQQFPEFDDTLPTLEGFSDSSWHNDACPSLSKELPNGDFICVFIDYKDKERSDFADLEGDSYARFRVGNHTVSGEYENLFQSNDWADIEKFIKEQAL
jgi:hypothetical protein